MSILPSNKDTYKNRSPFSDYVRIYDVPDKRLKEKILKTVRKWSDAIENFAQYIVRRLQSQGILCEITSNITPSIEGYRITITVKIHGIHEDTLKKHMRTINKIASERTPTSREYKRYEPGVRVE